METTDRVRANPLDTRQLIRTIPTDVLVDLVGLLTSGAADPQFVRAIVMNIKQFRG